MKKISLKKSCSSKHNWQRVFVGDMLRNKILRVCYYFCSKEWNSELVSLNGLEQNSKCLLLFLFHGTEFRVVFSSAEWFRTEFRKFPVLRNSRNSIRINQLFHLFHLPRNNFFVENCQPYCWGIREVAKGKNYFLSYEGRAMKGEIWVERDKEWVERGGDHTDAEREIRN